MVTEIQFILENQNSFVQGNAFERIVRDIIETHRYKVTSNVNYTGMEIDLIAEHLDRNNEVLYVECKAKEKVSSSEILSFEAKVRLKKASFGYFIRTKEYEHQAAGLVKELLKDERYNYLTFFDPEKVIELLISSKKLKEVKLDGNNATKLILAATYFGDYYLYILKNSLGAIPSHFRIFDASNGKQVSDEEIISKFKTSIPEINGLSLFLEKETEVKQDKKNKIILNSSDEIQTISEVQESENWYDYLPASSKHFIGREPLRNQVFEFYKDVINNKTKRRLFYLTGKSGWGKSSLIAELRGRSRNKHYKNKFYSIAIDTRSATSTNFVAISFEKLINSAKKANFLENSLFQQDIKFTSNNELLSSDSVKGIIKYLEKESKALILIFDQFEDVFRKTSLFQSFYKFLTDVTDAKTNIIVGFSWKTEILIPSENEAYYYWQQAKEQAMHFTVPEFGSKEINGVINQLEISTQKIGKDLKRRVIESSQGLPWLTKKLCIHLYNQIKANTKPETLLDDNLNIRSLFNADLETLNSDELATLKYIAKKASDGNFLDITEIGENVPESAITSLRDKRLIIRSGANYIIYWDIFRDYILTNDVPVINESYIIRQGVKVCMEIFLLFPNDNSSIKVESLDLKREIQKESLDNIFLELRNLGLIHKIENQDSYKVTNNVEVSKESFTDFITNKLYNNTIYQKILKWPGKSISATDIADILKDTFKGYTFQDKTWDTYAKTFISWLLFSNLDLKIQIIEPKKGRQKGSNSLILRNSPTQVLKAIKTLEQPHSRILYGDMRILNLIDINDKPTKLAFEVMNLQDEEFIAALDIENQVPYYSKLKKEVEANPQITAKDLVVKHKDYFTAAKESSNIIYASTALTWLKNRKSTKSTLTPFLLNNFKKVKSLLYSDKRLWSSRVKRVLIDLEICTRDLTFTEFGDLLNKRKDADFDSLIFEQVSKNPHLQPIIKFVRGHEKKVKPDALVNKFNHLFTAPSTNTNYTYARNLLSWIAMN